MHLYDTYFYSVACSRCNRSGPMAYQPGYKCNSKKKTPWLYEIASTTSHLELSQAATPTDFASIGGVLFALWGLCHFVFDLLIPSPVDRRRPSPNFQIPQYLFDRSHDQLTQPMNQFSYDTVNWENIEYNTKAFHNLYGRKTVA